MPTENPKHYLWCNSCRRSFKRTDAPDAICPVCGSPLHPMKRLNAIVRGFMSQELVSSDLMTKHRQLVRLIWTRNGMGEKYYRVLAPDVPYNRFEAMVTDILCRGSSEGWVKVVLPPAPTSDENAYRLEFVDEERFVAELDALAESTRKPVSSPD